MGRIVSYGGVCENLFWIMSLDRLCQALYDARDLVKAIADRFGRLTAGF